MSVLATLKLILKIKDISTDALVSSSDSSRTWDGGDVEKTLKSDSTPIAESGASVLITLVAGAATVDFTALANRDGDTRSANGKKIRAWLFKNESANQMVVTKGAANGLSPYGTTFTYTIPPGGCVVADFDDEAIAVDATHKNIDISGTLVQTLIMKAIWGT